MGELADIIIALEVTVTCKERGLFFDGSLLILPNYPFRTMYTVRRYGNVTVKRLLT